MKPRPWPLSFAFLAGLFVANVSAETKIPGAAQPQLAVAADGRLWLAYGRLAPATNIPAPDQADGSGHGGHGQAAPRPDGEIFVARSDDGGATFAPGVKAAQVPRLMLGMRRGPRIAVHGDTLTLTAVGPELVAFRSNDAGRTWTGPVTINDVPTSAREGLHDLTAAPDGRLFVTWLDLRNGKMELWGAESRDGGRTWSGNEQVYRSPDKSICECCHPSAIYDADGNLAVMWRNSIDGCRDLWMATRARGAQAFATARKLGEGTWKLNACPMDGGRIAALGGGRFGAVFQRAGDVFLVTEDGPEKSLGKGKQPVVAMQGKAPLVFWQDGADLVSLNGKKQANDARFPAIVSLPGQRGTVLAYEQGPAKEKQPGIVIERL